MRPGLLVFSDLADTSRIVPGRDRPDKALTRLIRPRAVELDKMEVCVSTHRDVALQDTMAEFTWEQGPVSNAPREVASRAGKCRQGKLDGAVSELFRMTNSADFDSLDGVCGAAPWR
jgi:hypothetical protein